MTREPDTRAPALAAGDPVVVHLVHPNEKLWGILGELTTAGVTLRGINLGSFDDWMVEVAHGEPRNLGPATMFLPMARVERIFLDEAVGPVESYCQRFRRRVGKPVEEYLGS